MPGVHGRSRPRPGLGTPQRAGCTSAVQPAPIPDDRPAADRPRELRQAQAPQHEQPDQRRPGWHAITDLRLTATVVRDLKAAWIRGIVHCLEAAEPVTLVAKGYISAGGKAFVPRKGRNKPQSQKGASSAHANRTPSSRSRRMRSRRTGVCQRSHDAHFAQAKTSRQFSFFRLTNRDKTHADTKPRGPRRAPWANPNARRSYVLARE